MIRGTQREMIMIRGDGESSFESVLFILRADLPPAKRKKEDMLTEAKRILAENYRAKTKGSKRPREWVGGALPAFFLGAIAGALFSALLLLIL
ncbi:MAG: hypothetical protein J6S10_04650 [Clostridia bacterium]|nr:hypothetical protein [Clostridia bacterium]